MADVANWEVASIDTDGNLEIDGALTSDSVTAGDAVLGGAGKSVQTAGQFILSAVLLSVPDIPTADPSNAGQVWSNSGVLTVSAG